MKEKINKYTTDSRSNVLYMAAALLDPRIKGIPFRGVPSVQLASFLQQSIEKYVDIEVAEPAQSPKLTTLKGRIYATVSQPVTQGSQLCQYLVESPMDSATDIVAFWRDKQHRYPILSRAAKSLLSIPASSAPSERVFSFGSDSSRRQA